MVTEITSTTSTFTSTATTTKNTIATFAASSSTITTVLLLLCQPQLPHRLLAHKDEEHEDSAKQVEYVHAEKEVVEEGVFKIRPVADQDRVDAFESPQKTKDEEELCVEYLHYCNRESDLD